MYFLLYNVFLPIYFEHNFLLVNSPTNLKGVFKFVTKFNKDTFRQEKNKCCKMLEFYTHLDFFRRSA